MLRAILEIVPSRFAFKVILGAGENVSLGFSMPDDSFEKVDGVVLADDDQVASGLADLGPLLGDLGVPSELKRAAKIALVGIVASLPSSSLSDTFALAGGIEAPISKDPIDQFEPDAGCNGALRRRRRGPHRLPAWRADTFFRRPLRS